MSGGPDDYPDAERTVFTLRALDFSALFNHYFSTRPVGGEVSRIAQVVEPEGMSTGQGATARQPIVLRDQHQNSLAVTAGWVDTAQDKAYLRTYQYLLQQHKARHGRTKFTLGEPGYNAFFREAMKFMHHNNIVCATDTEFTGSVATVTSKGRPKIPTDPWAVAMAAAGAVLLAGALFYFLFKA